MRRNIRPNTNIFKEAPQFQLFIIVLVWIKIIPIIRKLNVFPVSSTQYCAERLTVLQSCVNQCMNHEYNLYDNESWLLYRQIFVVSYVSSYRYSTIVNSVLIVNDLQ